MVIAFVGFSKCSICHEVIEKSEDLMGFPAFIPYDHKYGLFSDAALHKACYEKHPDREAVDGLLAAYKMILNSRPRNLKTLEEMEVWSREAFKDWPPKNGVVIFEPMFPDESPEEGFFMDADDYKAMCEAEDQYDKEREVRRAERYRRDREDLRT